MPDGIEAEADGLDHTLGAGSSQQRLQASDHLREGERLGQVVVAAGIEACQPIDQRVAGGQEEHRRLHALRSQRLAEVASVGIGKTDVDHEQIRRRLLHLRDQLTAAGDRLRAEALLVEAALEDVTQLGVVLGDEDARSGHSSRSIAPRGSRTRRGS